MIPLCTSATRPVGAEVRVGVDVVGRAVGGPAGVPDAGRGGGQRLLRERLVEVRRACRRACREAIRAVVHERDAGRVVAAVLQAPQPLDHDALGLLRADVPDDSAHGATLYRRPAPRPRPLPGAGLGVAHLAACGAWLAEPTSNGESGPYVELDRAAWAALGARHRAAADAPRRSTGSAASATSSTSTRCSRSTCRSRGCSACTPSSVGDLHRAQERVPAPAPTAAPPRRRSSSGSPARWRSASRRRPGCCSRCWRTGRSTPRSRWSPPTASCYPNAELERRGLLDRKGFPESYDRKALLRFVIDIKSGKDEVEAPTYSHLVYDVVPDEKVVVRHPDIVIIEGLNVLQPARVRDDGRTGLAISDFFDFSVYVDAATDDIRRWYVDRFLRLRETAFRDPASYFARYARLTEDEAVDEAHRIWDDDQRPQPQAERPAHPRPRDAGAAQGRRPLGALRAAAQALSARRRRASIRQSADGLEAQPHVDVDHPRVALGVLGVHLGDVGPRPDQGREVRDLHGGAEAVAAVVAPHQGAELVGDRLRRQHVQVGVRDGLAVLHRERDVGACGPSASRAPAAPARCPA